MSGFPGMRWLTSLCMRQAWMPQLRRAQRYLMNRVSKWNSNAKKTRQMNDENIPLTNEFRMDMARLEIPVSGCTCLRTRGRMSQFNVFRMKLDERRR
jgi:hypothetical protein